jgi:alpha-L-rhamnosidase
LVEVRNSQDDKKMMEMKKKMNGTTRKPMGSHLPKPGLIVLVSVLFFMVPCGFTDGSQELAVRALACEQLAAPEGVDTAQPMLSWKLDSNGAAQQGAYRIQVSDLPGEFGEDHLVWDSEWVTNSSARSVLYSGALLKSLHRYVWRTGVRSGKELVWSDPAQFTTGLMPGDAPDGQWIFHAGGDEKNGTSWFRKTVDLTAVPQDALVLIASRAHHEFYVNGRKVGDRALAPNASILEKRTLYVVYDIRELLTEGENTLAVWMGPARFAAKNTVPSFLLHATLDGRIVSSDSSWKTHAADLSRFYQPNTPSLHGGETIDVSKVQPGWNRSGFDDSAWAAAAVRDEQTVLSADLCPPTRVEETLVAKSVRQRPDGSVLVDFGGFFTGQLEAHVQGQPGRPVTLSALGDLEKPDTLGQFNQVIPDEQGAAVFSNRFNWICGRWVEVTGLTTLPQPQDFKIHRISMDLDRIGFFSSSDKMLNRIYETDLYTYRNLTLDGYNHDCTHRERRGYGEHAFATSRGMAGQYDLTAFVTKWLRDWRDVQLPSGYMPHTAPEGNGGGGTLWSSYTVLGAWDCYQWSGDRRVLQQNISSARDWMNYLDGAVADGLLTRYEKKNKYAFLGDWARPMPPGSQQYDGHVKAFGDDPLALGFNNGILALNLQTMRQVSQALGEKQDARIWEQRLRNVQPAIHKAFYDADSGSCIEPNQVLSMLMLMTGVTPSSDADKARSALDSELRSKNYIDAGSAGLPFFFEYIITHPEYHQWFYDVLHRRQYPGYAYFLDQRCNTWPELWNPDCASKVHSCYIGISSFFTRVLAGLSPVEPGYKTFSVKPSFVEGLNQVAYDFDSPFGWIRISWERSGREISLKVTVPPGASAEVMLPGRTETVGSGEHRFRIDTEKQTEAVQ